VVNPDQLQKTEKIWQVVVECQNEVVKERAIKLLNKLYTALDENMLEQRVQI
jgi:hypothetical protein